MMAQVSIECADLLQTIVAATRRVVDVRRAREPLSQLAARAEPAEPRAHLFRETLARVNTVNVIAECKRRSPARGVLRREYDAADIARTYERAGAAAISVLTEPTFFDGSLADLQAVRRAVTVPVLRKDFIVDSYQLVEARAVGADAVLLIAGVLSGAALPQLLGQAREWGLAALVEVHDAAELIAALDAGAEVVGVNNRNLRTLEIDPAVSLELIARIPRDVVAVSESGLGSAEEVLRLRRAGFRAFLIGEKLMTSPDPAGLLRTLVGGHSGSGGLGEIGSKE